MVGYLLFTGLGPERRRSLVGAAAVALALVGGMAVAAATKQPLERAQALQSEEPTVKDNLELEPVDFTTVGGLAKGLPLRVRDFLLAGLTRGRPQT